MIDAILSILILTSAIWVLNKILSIKICSICAGVTLTWLGMFFGMFFGKLSVALYQVPTAILAGGTVVGLMSKLEEFIKEKFILIWKTIFVVSGFTAVYSLIAQEWKILALCVIIDMVATFLFKTDKLGQENKESEQVKKLKEKMENCC